MAYPIQIRPKVERQLRRLPQRDIQRIRAAIAALAEDRRPRGALKLQGPIYRVRVGPYRVIYAVLDEEEIIVVVKVARRAEDTYDDVGEIL